MTELDKVIRDPSTSSEHHSTLFASSSFGSNISTKRINGTAEKKTIPREIRSDQSITMASGTKYRSSTCVSKVPHRYPSLNKQSDVEFMSGTKTAPHRRSPRVIHVSIFGTNKPYITTNNKVSASNINRHSSFYKTAKNNNHFTTRQHNSQLIDLNDQIGANGFVSSTISGAFTNSWLNRTNPAKDERGQILSGRHRKQNKKRNRPAFSRLCWLLCLCICMFAVILIGTLIATIVLIVTSSATTTTSVTTSLATTQTKLNLTTTTSIIPTTATTTTITDSTTTTITDSTTTTVTDSTTATITDSTTTTITDSTTKTTTTISETKTTSTSTTSIATICSTTAITTTVTSSSLPPQCSNYTLNTDGTRNAAYTVAGNACDNLIFVPSPMWVRFSGAAGTLLANCPVIFSNCNTNAAGWYSGVYPSTAGDTTNGTVCYTRPTYTCYYNNSISVTNCNGYYVFRLSSSPQCSLRYCTI